MPFVKLSVQGVPRWFNTADISTFGATTATQGPFAGPFTWMNDRSGTRINIVEHAPEAVAEAILEAEQRIDGQRIDGNVMFNNTANR